MVAAALAAMVCAAPAHAHTAPAWWRDAKFGIFIHWGPYSVPAWGPVSRLDQVTNITNYAEWYGETMTIPGSATWQHHLETYGPQFNYDDFIPQWTASKWDPDAWIRLFEQAGAKYFVLTAKHHDGVALWCTKTSHRNTCDMGPHRDLVADLMAAAHRAHDRVRPGLYFSIPEWFDPAPKEGFLYSGNSRWDSSTRLAFSYAFENPLPRRNPYTQVPIPYTGYIPVSDYATGIVRPQVEELIHEFHPSVLWCDIGGRETYYHANAWIDDYYKAVPDGVVNDRCGDLSTHADYTTVELPTDTAKPPFEVVQGLAGRGSSFGYNAAEPDSGYQTLPALLDTLVDTVARGGNLMLDIGPRADGTIPDIMVDRLRGIGAWLKVNGEAIYDSHAWTQPAAGDVRFTVGRAGFLYATSLGGPGRELTIDAPVPPAPGTRVALLGTDEHPLAYHREGSKLVVDLPPPSTSASAHDYVLRIGPPLTARLTARVRRGVVSGRLVLPDGVTRAMGCRGTVAVGRRRTPVRPDCRYRTRGARGARVRFTGNPVLRPARAGLALARHVR
jgi:alpha-L-fucosidase